MFQICSNITLWKALKSLASVLYWYIHLFIILPPLVLWGSAGACWCIIHSHTHTRVRIYIRPKHACFWSQNPRKYMQTPNRIGWPGYKLFSLCGNSTNHCGPVLEKSIPLSEPQSYGKWSLTLSQHFPLTAPTFQQSLTRHRSCRTPPGNLLDRLCHPPRQTPGSVGGSSDPGGHGCASSRSAHPDIPQGSQGT